MHQISQTHGSIQVLWKSGLSSVSSHLFGFLGRILSFMPVNGPTYSSTRPTQIGGDFICLISEVATWSTAIYLRFTLTNRSQGIIVVRGAYSYQH